MIQTLFALALIAGVVAPTAIDTSRAVKCASNSNITIESTPVAYDLRVLYADAFGNKNGTVEDSEYYNFDLSTLINNDATSPFYREGKTILYCMKPQLNNLFVYFYSSENLEKISEKFILNYSDSTFQKESSAEFDENNLFTTCVGMSTYKIGEGAFYKLKFKNVHSDYLPRPDFRIRIFNISYDLNNLFTKELKDEIRYSHESATNNFAYDYYSEDTITINELEIGQLLSSAQTDAPAWIWSTNKPVCRAAYEMNYCFFNIPEYDIKDLTSISYEANVVTYKAKEELDYGVTPNRMDVQATYPIYHGMQTWTKEDVWNSKSFYSGILFNSFWNDAAAQLVYHAGNTEVKEAFYNHYNLGFMQMRNDHIADTTSPDTLILEDKQNQWNNWGTRTYEHKFNTIQNLKDLSNLGSTNQYGYSQDGDFKTICESKSSKYNWAFMMYPDLVKKVGYTTNDATGTVTPTSSGYTSLFLRYNNVILHRDSLNEGPLVNTTIFHSLKDALILQLKFFSKDGKLYNLKALNEPVDASWVQFIKYEYPKLVDLRMQDVGNAVSGFFKNLWNNPITATVGVILGLILLILLLPILLPIIKFIFNIITWPFKAIAKSLNKNKSKKKN